MGKEKIICRDSQLRVLDGIMNSNESEFLAIYGRRRVGKTYLIREYFGEKGLFFELTGQKNAKLKDQLENFILKFSEEFFAGVSLERPKSWKDAFKLLNQQIEKSKKSEKFILFLDELPWLASKKSRIIEALEYYWNAYWSKRRDFVLIACGSAASWMLKNLINAKGGLHNRITKSINLKPYNLIETKLFLDSRGINYSEQQILDIYMIFGGIPHYLKQITKGKSPSQIVNNCCFSKDGLLYDEFDRLFKSLFDHAEDHEAIVKSLSKKRQGLTRDELIKETNQTTGGRFNERLQELEASGFIRAFPMLEKQKGKIYKIVDEYVNFYLRWISPLREKGSEHNKDFWKIKSQTSEGMAWKGYAFENICSKHIEQIADVLDLSGITFSIGSWRYLPKKGDKKNGAQIDLIIDRDDGIINIFEIKYSDSKFNIDKEYSRKLKNKIEVFEENFRTKKKVFLAMTTTKGIQHTTWSEGLVQNEVTLSDLFK